MRLLHERAPLALFALTSEGRVVRRDFGPGSEPEWEDVCGPLRGAPAVAANRGGHLEIFAAGPTGVLGHQWELDDAVGWTRWEPLGPPLRHDPVVFENDDGRLEVFAVRANGLLGHMWQVDTGGWSKWHHFDQQVRSKPAVFQNMHGRLELFAVGWDGRLGHMSQLAERAAGWSHWESFGCLVQGHPAAFQNRESQVEVFATGLGGRLGHTWQHGEYLEWSPWGEFGVSLLSDPAVFQNDDGLLEVFGVASDGFLGHAWHTEGGANWSAWESFEVPLRGTPIVARDEQGCLVVFGVGLDGRLGRARQVEPSGVWTAWEELGTRTITGMAVCQVDPSHRARAAALGAVVARATTRRPAGETVTADVCVIGAGPAGITVAEDLVQAGASVVMVESGSWNEEFEAAELNHGEAEGPILRDHLRYLRTGRRRQVQGSLNHWGRGWLIPWRVTAYQQRPWVPLSGWPVSAAEMRPYEVLAADTLTVETFGPAELQGPLARLTYHYPSDPLVFRARFRGLLAERRFRAELGTTAIELTSSDGRVSSVRCARAAGDEVPVSADVFVLAGGGIENARFLLLNESRLPVPPMTGRCFMDTPHVLAGTVMLPEAEKWSSYLGIEQSKMNVLGLLDQQMELEQLLCASAQLRAWGAPGSGPVTCQLYLRAEQAPNPDSRVVLDDRADRYGCRRPRLRWLTSGQDWPSIVRTAELVSGTLEEHFDARAKLSIDAGAPWPGHPAGPEESGDATWGNHHMGTTRMSQQPDEGVVDANCLLYGTSNLYLAGSSVFPTGSGSNPTFMIVAMAHRLAGHLAQRGSRDAG